MTRATTDDARHCAALVRAHARTFTLASRFLPAGKRRAAYALYAFCRVADDIVDLADGDRPAAAAALARHAAGLDAALAGAPEGPVFRELARVVAAHDVPPAVLRELLGGVARDLEPVRYRTWAELGAYCEGVASSVGEMCTYVFGVEGGRRTRDCALRYARTLGVAMQLTNILRDVGEDARRGRCYLPDADLAGAGLTRDAVLAAGTGDGATLACDPRWHRMMKLEIQRARTLYDAARPGIQLLAADARRCAAACATGYEAILGAIEDRRYDTLGGRARVAQLRRATILWRVWRGDVETAAAAGDGPAVAWALADGDDVRGPARTRLA